jgi:hypothetical protein
MKTLFILATLALFSITGYTAPLNKADPSRQVKAYLASVGYPSIIPRVVVKDGEIVEIHLNCEAPMPADWPEYETAKTMQDLAENGGIYAYQNAFLLLCDNVKGTNTHEKLSFESLPPILKAIKKGGEKARFDDLRDAFSTVNQALIKKAGLNWWDTCVWNDNPLVITNGTAIYSELMD